MHVELRVEARHDLLEGAWFYEQQREGLGDYFTDCLFEDLDRLEREAGMHATVFGLHRKLSKRFPFAIYYRIEESLIDDVAILDCRRDPDVIAARASASALPATLSVTRLRRTCSRTGTTSVRFKSCLAMRAWKQPWSTRTS